MKQVIYFEHYPHYLGTMNNTVRLTPKQFEELLDLGKALIKDEDDETASDRFEDLIVDIEEKQKVRIFALYEALTERPRRPASIKAALNKKGVWADEWEEGSFAFATTERKAKKAVAKIEARHHEIDW